MIKERSIKTLVVIAAAGFAAAVVGVTAQQRTGAPAAPAPVPTGEKALPAASRTAPSVRATLDQYCISCHSTATRAGGLALDAVDADHPGAHADVFEKVVVRLRQRSMPPPGLPRPNEATYDALATGLERQLDQAWKAAPNVGRVSPVHRLNRIEYNNAIRDLFALDVDVTSLLPADETADGSFDNFGDVLSLSTAHLDRYMSVARQVTRLATGLPPANATTETFEVPLHVVQDDRRSEDLPLGSRGGVAVRYTFPVDGEYSFQVRLRTNWQDYIMGLGWPQQLDVRVDGERVARFTIGGDAPGTPSPESFTGPGEPGSLDWEAFMMSADRKLEVRVPVTAGTRVVGVSYLRELWEPEGVPQPMQRGRLLANDELYMDYQAVHALQIGGPYTTSGVGEGTAKDTPSRRAVFVCEPQPGTAEAPCAERILSRLARRAYRRPVTGRDLTLLRGFFERGRKDGGSFEAGIQFALEFMITDPAFLLRVHKETAPGARQSDVELASRLSFFLWSSIPDDTLLDLAVRGRLSEPAVLERQVKRMLADPRAVDALAGNFAGQWLNLRRVAEVIVDPEAYPHFDTNLLEAFQTETSLFVGTSIRDDRPVSELLNADYTFVNERLARHYGIPGVYGSRFRRVTLPNLGQRGGLLGQGALLAATSYPDRTSPVLRGKWLLDNILGTPIPPPPPGVDTNLDSKPGQAAKSIRERLAQHRANPVCASCHSLMDPLGFALENFDVLGGWSTADETGHAVDAEGRMASGATVAGFAGLRRLLLARPDQFPRTVTEKLLSYALGRRLESFDQPVVRTIVRDAQASGYRWSSIVLGIAGSEPFLRRGARPVAAADARSARR